MRSLGSLRSWIDESINKRLTRALRLLEVSSFSVCSENKVIHMQDRMR